MPVVFIITYLINPLTSVHISTFFSLTHIYTQTVTWVSVLPKDIWHTHWSRIMRKTLMKLVSHCVVRGTDTGDLQEVICSSGTACPARPATEEPCRWVNGLCPQFTCLDAILTKKCLNSV